MCCSNGVNAKFAVVVIFVIVQWPCHFWNFNAPFHEIQPFQGPVVEVVDWPLFRAQRELKISV
jgi:hypothetical protein